MSDAILKISAATINIDNSLDVDKNLKLSADNLLSAIKSQVKIKKIPKLEKLKSVPKFPSTPVFASLALKVYEDLANGNVKLPDGWQLVSTATNKETTNGYFGAVFLNPETNHVVMAHRGTEVTNVGSLVTDLAGIVLNACAGQMESACTFSDMVVDALKTIEKENEGEIHFELFFTGHSLGAWLSQVTTFSNSFLNRVDNKFVRREKGEEAYHAHAVVFDSPGGRPMLQKLKKNFENENDPISLENLSITCVLSAPNQVNTCNEHFGQIYRIFIDTSNMTVVDRSVGYTLATHSMDKIEETLNAQGGARIDEVLEWPIRVGVTGGEELTNFMKIADYRNSFHIRLKDAIRNEQLKYLTVKPDWTKCLKSVFDLKEKRFLEHFRWIRQLPEYEKIKELFEEFRVSKEIEENLKSFDFSNQHLTMGSREQLDFFIPYVKLLLKLFPSIVAKAQKLLEDEQMRAKIFSFETKLCLERNELLDFNFPESDLDRIMQKQYTQVKVKNAKAWFGMSMMYQAFEKSKYRKNYGDSQLLILDIKRFLVVNEVINAEEFLEKVKKYFLVMVYCDKKQKIDEVAEASFRKLFRAFEKNPQVKLIVIGDDEDSNLEVITKHAKDVLQNKTCMEIEKILTWNDLTAESRGKLLERELTFQTRTEKLRNLVNQESPVIFDDVSFEQILDNKFMEVNFDPLSKCDFEVCTCDHEKKEITSAVLLENLQFKKDIFVISGIYEENPPDAARLLKNILKPQNRMQETLIDQNVFVDSVGGADFTKKLIMVPIVGSEGSLQDFDEKCRRMKDTDRTLHWIKIKEDKLTWRKSFNYGEYINRKEKPVASVAANMKEKVIVVTGINGEGKTAFLVNFARGKLSTSWVVFLNLGEISFDGFNADSLDHDSLSTFINNAAGLCAENPLHSFLLRHNLERLSQNPIQFIFDGFDNIARDKDRTKSLKIMKFIKSNTPAKIIFSTRDASAEVLKDLQPAVYIFENLQRLEREALLREYWRARTILVWGPKKCDEIFSEDKKSKFKTFVKMLLDTLDSLIEEKAKDTMGVPEQLRFLGSGFQEDFEKHAEMGFLRQKALELFRGTLVYQQYMKSKYALYVTAKSKIGSIDEKSKSVLQTVKNVGSNPIQEAKDLIKDSEYLSTDYVILQITKGQSPPKVLQTLTGYLLTDSKLGHIRTYLNKNEKLLPSPTTFEVTDEIITSILGTPMLTVTKEGHDRILNFLLEVVKKKSDLKNVSLGKDESGNNSLYYAAEKCDAKCLKLLLEFLVEFGEKKEFKANLTNINTKFFKKIYETCKDRELVENLEKIIANNGIKK